MTLNVTYGYRKTHSSDFDRSDRSRYDCL